MTLSIVLITQYSMFGSILTLGGLIGAVFSGKVADVLGRKRVNFRFDFVIWFGFTSYHQLNLLILTFLPLFSGKKKNRPCCFAKPFALQAGLRWHWLRFVSTSCLFCLYWSDKLSFIFHILKDALWLDCGRLLLGIGVGLFSYVVKLHFHHINEKLLADITRKYIHLYKVVFSCRFQSI